MSLTPFVDSLVSPRAPDVVFSLERVMHPLSNFKSAVQGIGSAKRVDDLTVDFIMSEPNPVLHKGIVQKKLEGWRNETHRDRLADAISELKRLPAK
jgi:hypothetical protein